MTVNCVWGGQLKSDLFFFLHVCTMYKTCWRNLVSNLTSNLIFQLNHTNLSVFNAQNKNKFKIFDNSPGAEYPWKGCPVPAPLKCISRKRKPWNSLYLQGKDFFLLSILWPTVLGRTHSIASRVSKAELLYSIIS